MNKPYVSILTLTQLSRFSCLKILLECIKNQTYQNIKEWIIIEGSQNIDDANCNKALVNELINENTLLKFNIKYIDGSHNSEIYKNKNQANKEALGDYLLWMDDDDYHLPGQVEYSVNKLFYTNKDIGANQNIYIHDIDYEITYKTNYQNNIFAESLIYKKEYINEHSFIDNTLNGFIDLSKFETLMPEMTFIKFSHNNNSNKSVKQLTTISMNDNNLTCQKLEKNVYKYLIPDTFYSKYCELLKSKTKEYDITYYTGISNNIIWDPVDKSLSGSEKAIVNLSENWVKLGKTVGVYSLFNFDNKTINGVDYINSKQFNFSNKLKTLIIWRTSGIIPFLDIEPNADKIILDLHDNFSYTLAHLDRTKLNKFLEKVSKANFKSEYHKKSFEKFIGGQIIDGDYNIIPNGLQLNEFSNNKESVIRNPYRFCYCSCYSRGLENILENIWPLIYKEEPRAELHVYYGMDYLYDENYKNKLKMLLSQPGVMDHGRQPTDMIVREKYLSTFHLYITDTEYEIDCISIRESLITGCIPLISKIGVFAERHGLQYSLEPSNKEQCKEIVNDIVLKMRNNEFIKQAREQLRQSNTIVSWETIANEWLKTF